MNSNARGRRCASSRKSLKSLPGDPPPKEVHKLRTATRRVEAIAAALADNERNRGVCSNRLSRFARRPAACAIWTC